MASASAFSAAKEKWDVYFLLVNNYAAKMQHSEVKYGNLLDDGHVIVLQSTESAPAVIASLIGIAEDTVDAGSLATELAESGFSGEVALAAVRATTGTVAKADDSYADLAL